MKWWRGFVGAFMFLAAAPGCTGSSTGDTGSLTTGGSGAGGASSGGTSVGGSSGGAVNATGAASATGGGVSVAGAAGSTTVEPPAELPLTVAFTGSGANRGVNADNGPLNIGHQFSVSRSVTMVDLGVWDEGADGLARSHVVTLFRLDQQGPDAQAELIVGGSVTVPAGVVAELEDGFRFASLATPLVLEPGDYAVIAYGLGADDAYGDGGGYPVPESGVQNGSFTPWEFVDSASPAYPSGGDTGRTVSVSFGSRVDKSRRCASCHSAIPSRGVSGGPTPATGGCSPISSMTARSPFSSSAPTSATRGRCPSNNAFTKATPVGSSRLVVQGETGFETTSTRGSDRQAFDPTWCCS